MVFNQDETFFTQVVEGTVENDEQIIESENIHHNLPHFTPPELLMNQLVVRSICPYDSAASSFGTGRDPSYIE